MNISKLITVVIPAYNEEGYIYNTLKFISNQIFEGKLKVIISDGNSTDGTLGKIFRAKNDFKNLNIKLIKGGSVSVGRNEGARLVKTPYILFIDADSILVENDIFIETLKYIDTHSIITCKQTSLSTNWKSQLIWDIFNVIRKIIPESFSTGCYFFIHTNMFRKLGGFDEVLTNSEDFWLSRKVPKKYFKIINRHVGQDDRRFKKMGYINFIYITVKNYINKNNKDYFKKDIGYWI
jgi:glycosyltransferase involved in cell wall biosynthesis